MYSYNARMTFKRGKNVRYEPQASTVTESSHHVLT